ncbi:exported hypothetical protein [Candidatus Sulfopaludibacter sp. SbA4]|nr:exported hypothetical protein [Candidatus Sulfopaludibacter sp. SbA4]
MSNTLAGATVARLASGVSHAVSPRRGRVSKRQSSRRIIWAERPTRQGGPKERQVPFWEVAGKREPRDRIARSRGHSGNGLILTPMPPGAVPPIAGAAPGAVPR